MNFWAAFESAPDAYLLLAPDAPRFTMVAANHARLLATGTRREDVVGRPLFEVFPDWELLASEVIVEGEDACLHDGMSRFTNQRSSRSRRDSRNA